MKRGIGVIIVTGIFCLTACKQDVSYNKDQLAGHWALYAAERDGKPTSTLDGAIFQFQDDGTMNTNVTGDEYSGPYEIQENKVTFQGTEPMTFEIIAFTGDSLSLNTELQGKHFILDLYKTKTESE